MSQTLTESIPTPQAGADFGRAHMEYLGKATLFKNLPESVLARLLPISELMTIEAGTHICRRGEQASHLYVLADGQVTLSNTAGNGTIAVVEVIQPTGHFILATMLARLPFLMDAHATAPSTLVAIRGEALLSLIQEDALLATALLRAEALDFRAMVRQVCDLKLRTTAQRLGCYLLEQAGQPIENKCNFRLPFDKRLLAARLGCRQENLSRAFAALREVGVETHGSRVILHDVQRLRDYSGPDEPLLA